MTEKETQLVTAVCRIGADVVKSSAVLLSTFVLGWQWSAPKSPTAASGKPLCAILQKCRPKMRIRILYLANILLLFTSCGKKENKDILESDIKYIYTEPSYLGERKKYKIGKYKIDYSDKGFIKISYSETYNFGKPQKILLNKNDKYYDYFDLSQKDSLSKKSYLFLSKNYSDSYRSIEKTSTSNLEPPPPYFDEFNRTFEYFDDSIIFKKIDNLNLMYIKDNNLGRITAAEYYYDDDFRIKKIVERFGKTTITYK